jgi:CheY-specific phosphatase CheX
VGELTNQLIGRIKNRLLRRGVEVYITTPVVLRGRQLALDADGAIPTPMFFAGARGGVAVWIDTDADGEVTFCDDVELDVAEEGSALLF